MLDLLRFVRRVVVARSSTPDIDPQTAAGKIKMSQLRYLHRYPTERFIVARGKKSSRGAQAPQKARRRLWNYPRSHVKGFRRWLPSWRIVVGTFLMGMGLSVGLATMAYYSVDVDQALESVEYEKSTVYWSDGTTKMVEWSAENRTIVDYDALPQCDGSPQAPTEVPGQGRACLGNAVVASEDKTFWTNSGVDPFGIARALVNNLSGGNQQGASTLTQQYVERYYQGQTLSYVGKAKEAILALKIAQREEKSDILERYLNTIYFGRGAYGIEAASQAYFGKPSSQLNLSQSAFLSGIIPSPNKYGSTPDENREIWAQYRWNRTLDQMIEMGFITPEQKAQAVFPRSCTVEERDGAGCPAETVILPKPSDRMAGPTGYLIEMVRQELLNAGFSQEQLERDGLTIVTTFDQSMQQAAVEQMESVRGLDPAPSPQLHSTLVSIDPKDHSVKSLYGGQDYLKTQFNDAVQGGAQAGSTFKPFTLIAALEEGWSLKERYNGDNKLRVEGWEKPVTNFGYQSFGQVDLTKATAFSINSVYAELNHEVGPRATAWTAYRAGIGRGKNPDLTEDTVTEAGLSVYESNVLGTDDVHPVDLANAYATIASGGTYRPWHVVQEVRNKDGDVRFSADDAYQSEPTAIKPDAAAGAMSAMQQVISMKGASGNPALDLKRPAAGKTGTSNDNKSAWFAGFTPQMVTVVGLFQSPDDGSQGAVPITPFGKWEKRGREITGATWPIEAWTEYMSRVLEGQPKQDFPKYRDRPPTASPSPSETPSATPSQSAEPSTIVVPKLTGISRDQAIASLKSLGLGINETRESSEDVPRGYVIRAVPEDTSVPVGSTVTLVVSEGRPARPSPSPDPTPTEAPDPNNPVPDPNKPGGGGNKPGPGGQKPGPGAGG